MTEYYLGVDLGGTNVELALVDADGQAVQRDSLPTYVERGPEQMAARATTRSRELIDQANIAPQNVKGMGIGTPGPMSVSQGKIIRTGNLPGFDNFALRAEFSAVLGVPAVMDNDANSACWGEFWLGAGEGLTDMVMLTLGTGIGGGIIAAGELVHGCEDNAAELGHMIVQPDGRQCTCGQRGCIEAYSSATHTAARANEALAVENSSSLKELYQENGAVTCKDVFEHAGAGDTLANKIIDGTARMLALVCVSLRHVTEPQAVVFAGGMIKSADLLIPRIRSFYYELVWRLKPEPMDIRAAQLGLDAGVLGAAGLARHAHEQNNLIPPGV